MSWVPHGLTVIKCTTGGSGTMEGESTAVLWGNPLFGTASVRGYYEDEIRSVEGPDASMMHREPVMWTASNLIR